MGNSGIDWTEVPFTKSSHSSNDGGDCVEIGVVANIVGIRDSKLGASSPVLELTKTALTAFLAETKSGTFDLPE